MTENELREKVRKVIELGKQIFVFATVDDEGRPHSRYMGVLDIAPDYSAFFLACETDSEKVHDVVQNPHSQLLFATPDFLQVATVSGRAEMVESAERKREFWEANPVLAGYFASPDDAKFGMIRFVPEYAEYLDLNVGYHPTRVEWGKWEVGSVKCEE